MNQYFNLAKAVTSADKAVQRSKKQRTNEDLKRHAAKTDDYTFCQIQHDMQEALLSKRTVDLRTQSLTSMGK